MLPDRQRLEQRREVLKGAILYVEEQCRPLSRESEQFLEWARHDLVFAETLLQQKHLLEKKEVRARAARVAA
jgi:hypothetical protein